MEKDESKKDAYLKYLSFFNEVDYKKVFKYNISEFIDQKLFDINMIIDRSKNMFLNEFKNEKYYCIYDYLCNVVLDYELEPTFELFFKISQINKGQNLIRKIYHLNNLTLFEKRSIYIESIRKGTLPIFLFWGKYMEKDFLKSKKNKILIMSIENNDERIYKYILKNYDIDCNKIISDKKLASDLIFSIIKLIDLKILLRKFKYLNKYFDFRKVFNIILKYVDNLKMFTKLSKYYYVKCVSNISEWYFFASAVYHELTIYNIKPIFYDFLKGEDKNLFFYCLVLINIFENGANNSFDEILDFCFENIYDNKYSFFSKIDYDNNYFIEKIFLINNMFEINNKYFTYIIKNVLIKDENLICKYIINKKICKNCNNCPNNISLKNLLFLLPYCSYINGSNKYCLFLNKLSFHLRLFLRYKFKKKLASRKFHYYPIINEIRNLKPKENIKVLNKNSVIFRTKNQKYNNRYPINIYYNQINKLNKMLIREKADGVLSKSLPINIYPNNNFKNIELKSEYIEELDLYLVFDIKINNFDIIDRYNYLRKIHPYTKDTSLNCVSNYNELKKEIKKERELFNCFLNEDYDDYRWYPKSSYLVNHLSKNFGSEIINNIILEGDYNFICKEGQYKQDGIILVPFDGNTELKVKPKSEMSIDLLHINNKFYDNERNDWTHIIDNNMRLKNNQIVRCYPKNDKYFVSDIRFDKKYANPYKIVSTLMCMYKNNWIIDNNRIYYKNKKFRLNKFWKNIIHNNDRILRMMINKVKPMNDNNWLDLGCGNGKIFNIIRKNYKYKNYLGIDKDVNVLLNCLERFSYCINHNTNFLLTDLNKDWNNYENMWCKVNFKVTMKYILCIFSLSHFYSNKFWENLNKITKEGSIMIFNIVNNKCKERINVDSSYIYIDDEMVKFKFSHIHDEEISEKYISKDLLVKDLELYRWKINYKYCSKNHFENIYDWYIIERY